MSDKSPEMQPCRISGFCTVYKNKILIDCKVLYINYSQLKLEVIKIYDASNLMNVCFQIAVLHIDLFSKCPHYSSPVLTGGGF